MAEKEMPKIVDEIASEFGISAEARQERRVWLDTPRETFLPLCRWLKKHKLPLFIWHTEISWESLYRLARLFPDLPIILETQTKKILYHTRNLFSIMRECPNVYVETSNFTGSGYIEYTVREFGAGRLIFGSFLPVNDPFVAIGMVLDADIDEKEKKFIASENLFRLVGGVMP